MYLPRSHTGNIFPSWTIVVRHHHVYLRKFDRPSCNSAASFSVNFQSLAGVNYLACSLSPGHFWESLREGPYRLLGTVGAPSFIQILVSASHSYTHHQSNYWLVYCIVVTFFGLDELLHSFMNHTVHNTSLQASKSYCLPNQPSSTLKINSVPFKLQYMY